MFLYNPNPGTLTFNRDNYYEEEDSDDGSVYWSGFLDAGGHQISPGYVHMKLTDSSPMYNGSYSASNTQWGDFYADPVGPLRLKATNQDISFRMQLSLNIDKDLEFFIFKTQSLISGTCYVTDEEAKEGFIDGWRAVTGNMQTYDYRPNQASITLRDDIEFAFIEGGTSYLTVFGINTNGRHENTCIYLPILLRPRTSKYNIVYDANGGYGYTASQQVVIGNSVQLRQNGFTRTGYIFKGWATSPTGDVVYNEGQIVSGLSSTNGAQVTLYAVWGTNNYKLDLNIIQDGNSVCPNDFKVNFKVGEKIHININDFCQDVAHGTTYQITGVVCNQEKYNYTYDSGVFTVTGDSTINVYITLKNYAISVTAGTGISSVSGGGSYTYGSTATINCNLKTGYHFVNWTGSDTKTTKSFSFTVTGAKSYTANGTLNIYKVVFNANGGSGNMLNQGFTYGSAQNLRANGFSRTGYTFTGWKAEYHEALVFEDGTGVSSSGEFINDSGWYANREFLPIETNGKEVTFTTNYRVCGIYAYDQNQNFIKRCSSYATTHTVPSNTKYIRVEVNKSDLAYASRPNLRIERQDLFTNSQNVNNLASTHDGTVTMYAQWSINSYTIKFNANGGSGSMTNQVFTYGTAQNLKSNTFTRTGYRFVGWALSSTARVTYNNGAQIYNYTTENGKVINLYAKWMPNLYKITYNCDGGNVNGKTTFQDELVYGDSLGKKNIYDPSKPSLSSILTYSSSDKTFNINYKNTSSSTVFANFCYPFDNSLNPNTKYTVVLECLSGSIGISFMSPFDVGTKGDVANAKLDMRASAGNYSIATFTSKATIPEDTEYNYRSYIGIGSGVTVNAKFRISVFVGDIYAENFSYATLGNKPSTNRLHTPVKNGYIFNGWYNGSTKVNEYSVINSNATIKAQWIETFISNPKNLEEPKGLGTSTSPYTIENYKQLAWLSYKVNVDGENTVYAKQTGDIVFPNNMASWYPIGTENKPFKGSYDGQKYLILNLKADLQNFNGIGMFGYVNGVNISNVVMYNTCMKGYADVGGIVGNINYNNTKYTTITGCYIEGEVSSSDDTGGIVGEIGGFTNINNCIVKASLNSLDDDEDYMGAIFGYVADGNVNIWDMYVESDKNFWYYDLDEDYVDAYSIVHKTTSGKGYRGSNFSNFTISASGTPLPKGFTWLETANSENATLQYVQNWCNG